MHQLMIQLFDIGQRPPDLSGFQLSLERLEMVMKIMLVSPHFLVDTADLVQVPLGLFRLICGQFQIVFPSHRNASVLPDKGPVNIVVFSSGQRDLLAALQPNRRA